jgi:hypothetical protein
MTYFPSAVFLGFTENMRVNGLKTRKSGSFYEPSSTAESETFPLSGSSGSLILIEKGFEFRRT